MAGEIKMGALPFPRIDLAPIIGHKKKDASFRETHNS